MDEFINLSSSWPTIQRWLLIGGVALAIFLLFVFFARKSKRFLRVRLVRRMDDSLLANFLAGIFSTLIILIGLLIVLRVIGLTGIVSGLLAGAGISAFIIGFALKDIGENFLAGIILAFKRPFRVGDIVDIGGIRGTVLAMNLRDTQVKTADGKDVFIPNGMILKNPLVNYTIDGFLRYDFMLGLDYGSDYNAALDLIRKSILEVPGVLTQDKLPQVWVTEMGESTLNIQITFWVDTFERAISDAVVKSSAILTVLTAMEKAGFNMPARIVELKNYQSESLKTATPDSL
ncbi:mechanosensitive ion channel family protein [Algoriphagus halophytocola]|uniref:Mechanosensitive ion channel family protein n=1 Tax=Algoriphagus halophytocola TaxID=2991499 RepID=A0ABY6MCU1_9BACT|nr:MULTISPECIES: mechanosensitive ion channel family protein [unclassified Algoriphagus]UZD21542.1 mechanosensitive ion channel family protein [Algoriphagus sp. TR-M5]WBL42754.1 mechanosensitive ion channel family protein [Algoriphagus sp. TR-M9]